MATHLLAILVFLPALAGLAVFVLPQRQARNVALLIGLAELALAVVLALSLQPTPSWQFEEKWVWLLPWHLRFHAAVDGISGFLVLATALLTVLALLAVPRKDDRAYYWWLLVFMSGMLGALVSIDVLVFYLFWEVMLVPAFFLIGVWGGAKRVPATVKFVLMTVVGSLAMLAAVLYLGVKAEATGAVWPFDYASLLPLQFSLGEEVLLFFAFMAAFAVKIPLFPLHIWLPAAYGEAPTAGVMLMSGIMAKLGAYGLLRFALPLFPHAALGCALPLGILAVVGIVYGALLALGQNNSKQVIAYSSFSHLGWIALGLVAFNVIGITGGVFQMLSHAASTGALFLLVGLLWERQQTFEASHFGGLARTAPLFATCFVVAGLSAIGLPGSGGFIGEFLILLGTWGRSPVLAAIGGLGMIIGAAYMLYLAGRLLFGPVGPGSGLSDLRPREAIAVLPLVVASVVLGLFPQPLLDRIEPSARGLLAGIESRLELGPAPPPLALLRPRNSLSSGHLAAVGQRRDD